MPLSTPPIYHADVTNHDGQIFVVLYGTERLFSRTFYNICDAERWLTTLARHGLTQRATSYLNDEGKVVKAMGPLGAIAVQDKRVRKRASLRAVFA